MSVYHKAVCDREEKWQLKNNEEIQIVIIELSQSVMVRGIKNRLDELHFKVTVLGNNLSEIERYCGKVDLFILYLSDSIIGNSTSIATIEEVIEDVNMDKQKMVLVGEKDYLADISKRMMKLNNFDRFNLPIDMDKLEEMINNVLMTEGTVEKKSILIVDDDPDYAKMVRSWINEDYTVNIVTGGMQAIKFITKKNVDLILLDYEMPIVDGPKVFEMIKTEEESKNIPVVFLTGNGTREGVLRVMQLEPAGYILKGASKQELQAKIKSVLAKYGKGN